MRSEKILKNLLIDFIPESFKISYLKPERNKNGIYLFRFRIFFPERNFEMFGDISKTMLFLGTLPEIRILSKDYIKIKESFENMLFEFYLD